MPGVQSARGANRAVLATRGRGGYLQYRIPAIVALPGPTAPAPNPTSGSSTLCLPIPAAPGDPTSGIPGFARLLGAYDARLNLDDLPAPIDLLLRISDDGGRTWSGPALIRGAADPAETTSATHPTPGASGAPGAPCTIGATGFEGFGDPSLLACPTTGRVLLFHSATVYAGFFESTNSLSDTDPYVQHADLSISEDGGLTWRHRRLSSALRTSGNRHFKTSAPVKPPPPSASIPTSAPSAPSSPDGSPTDTSHPRISGLFATSGAGCAITDGAHAGRLVQPYVLRVGDEIHVACALSDDHGDTWSLGAPVPVATVGPASAVELNESSVAALPGGRLILHSRGVGSRLQAYSEDGGESFSPAVPVPDLVDSGTNGSIILAPADTASSPTGATHPAPSGPTPPVLLASHTADPDLRRRAVISRSDDGGATWREVRTITTGAAGYTQMVAIGEDRVGVVYEANGYQQIIFESYDVAELTSPPTPCPPPDSSHADSRGAPNPGAGWCRELLGDLLFDVVLRSITPEPVASETEAGHRISLSEYGNIPPTVFKEIGHTGDDGVQVIHTRETLRRTLQSRPSDTPTLPGEVLTFHGRVRNTGPLPIRIAWSNERRTLEPGEQWVRRDITHTIAAPIPGDTELTDFAPRPQATKQPA